MSTMVSASWPSNCSGRSCIFAYDHVRIASAAATAHYISVQSCSTAVEWQQGKRIYLAHRRFTCLKADHIKTGRKAKVQHFVIWAAGTSASMHNPSCHHAFQSPTLRGEAHFFGQLLAQPVLLIHQPRGWRLTRAVHAASLAVKLP